MRKITLFLVLAFCLTMFGCSKDAEVSSFLTEWDDFTNDILRKINAGDVDGAKIAFDAKKDNLRSKLTVLQNTKDNLISADARKKFDESFVRNRNAMMALYFNSLTKFPKDQAKGEKLKALVAEYAKLFKMFEV